MAITGTPTASSRWRQLASSLGNGANTLFIASLASSVINLAFHMTMSRMLGPATYGALGSMLGLVTVFTLAVTAIQAAVTQSTSSFNTRQPDADMALGRPLRKAAQAGLLIAISGAAVSPLLKGFLHLGSVLPILLFSLFLAITTVILIPQGVLLGKLNFRSVASAVFVGAAVRLATAIIFVKAGMGLDGAVLSSVISALVILAMEIWPIRRQLRVTGTSLVLELRFGSAVLAVLVLGGASAFVGIDSFLARHFLSATQSGQYVAAATAARIALFLPQVVTLIVFPRFASSQGRGAEARKLLVIALAVVAVLSGLAGLALFIAPYHVLLLLFGHRYGGAASTLRILAFAATATAITSIVIYFHLARRSAASLASWIGMIAVTIAILIAHKHMTTIAWSVFACSVAVLIGVLWAALMAPTESGTAEAAPAPQWPVPEEDLLDVTMVIPYYNPGPRLRQTVEQLVATLEEQKVTFEVITVSDGSTDGSENDLTGLPSEKVRSIRLAANQGKGAALRLGLALGKGRYLGFIDADGDLPASQMASFISLVRSHQPDLVIGSKRHPMSEVVYPPLRRIYSAVWQLFSRILFRLNVRDTQTGLKLVKREVLEAALPRMLEKRFAFDLELIVVSNRMGFKRTFEAPVVIIERFGSTVSLKSVWRTFVDSLAIFYRLRILHYYDEQHHGVELPEFVDLSLTAKEPDAS